MGSRVMHNERPDPAFLFKFYMRFIREKEMFQRKLIILVPILFLNACVLHQSPAPGCSIVIGPSGCFGRTIITDLVVTPKSQLLTVDVNNGNGGVVDVSNK